MQYQYERAQLAEDAFNVHAETGLTPRQLAEQRAELLRLLLAVRDACLYEDDNFTGVTEEPHISVELFSEICDAINTANAERKP